MTKDEFDRVWRINAKLSDAFIWAMRNPETARDARMALRRLLNGDTR